MECRDFLEWVSEYVDGELQSEQLEELKSHLAVCPVCRAAEQELRDLRLEMRGAIESLPLPLGLEERILSSVWASDRKAHQTQTAWTALLLALLFSPFFLLLSPVFAVFVNLVYVSGMALGRTGFTLLKFAPALLSVSLAVVGLIIMGLGSYLVRKLLRDIPANEVFS